MFGLFRRTKMEPLDFRGRDLSPEEACGRAEGRPVLLDIPAGKIYAVGFNGGDTCNPFVLTIQSYGEGCCPHFRGSLLEDFYARWQPFAGKDPAAVEKASPWRERPVRTRDTAAGRLRRGEFRELARDLGVRADEIRGHIKGGPVTEAFGEVTFQRMARLYDSVRKTGYRPEISPAGHLRGGCFLHDGDFRVFVSSGKHRVVALLALGWKSIPVQLGPPKVPPMVRRREVDEWPGVRGGTHTREEALAEFDGIFSTVHPSGWRPPHA